MSETAETLELSVPVFQDAPHENFPDFYVVESNFHATKIGAVISLSIPTKIVRGLGADNRDEIDQFYALLEQTGRHDLVETLDDQDFVDTNLFIANFFTAFKERTQVRLGESLRSSK